MDYNTERFLIGCAVCGRMTGVQKLDEPALCDDHTHRDLRELKREAQQSNDVDAALRRNRRI